MQRVELQPAYVLHWRPYRDTSALIDFFTRDHGCVRAVVKGVYGSRKTAQRQRSLMQPGVPLMLTWYGGHDLKTLISCESVGGPLSIQGQRLFCLLYANELITRLASGLEGDDTLFGCYTQLLFSLAGNDLVEPLLRNFELDLLEILGLVQDLTFDQGRAQPVQPASWYRFDAQNGVVAAPRLGDRPEPWLFLGEHLLAISRRDFSDPVVLVAAKRLLRSWLAVYLGDKPLQSRRLFLKS